MSAVFLTAREEALEAPQYPISIVKAKTDEHAKGDHIKDEMHRESRQKVLPGTIGNQGWLRRQVRRMKLPWQALLTVLY